MYKSMFGKALLLSLTLIGVFASTNAISCKNDTIHCFNSSNQTIKCNIYKNNATVIKEIIQFCSIGMNNTIIHIHIFPNFNYMYHTQTWNLTINPAENIKHMIIDVNLSIYYLLNNMSIKINIKSQKPNNISKIETNSFIIFNKDFLKFFQKLDTIIMQNIAYINLPSFVESNTLTYISVDCMSLLESNTLNKSFVSGLIKLKHLSIVNCSISNISDHAFSGLASLTYLNLSNNKLFFFSVKNFFYLASLKTLILNSNLNIITIKNYATFSPLKVLEKLSLSDTRIIPFDAFSTLRSLKEIAIPYTDKGIVPSDIFQNLNQLKTIDFNYVPIVCNCSMQWIAVLRHKFNYSIENAICKNVASDALNQSLYSACGITESYQCFNNSNNCENTCINTPNSYICACDEGYGLLFSLSKSSCVDIDECLNNETICKHNCRNTLGSYACYCNTGYQLALNTSSFSTVPSTQCEDIDECETGNFTCQHKCINKVGSYICDCNEGYKIDPYNISKCISFYNTDKNLAIGMGSLAAILFILLIAAVIVIYYLLFTYFRCKNQYAPTNISQNQDEQNDNSVPKDVQLDYMDMAPTHEYKIPDADKYYALAEDATPSSTKMHGPNLSRYKALPVQPDEDIYQDLP